MNHSEARPQHTAAVAVSAPREHALDALRTAAVLGMMAAHTARLMPFEVRPDWSRWILLVEPVIPSLFLFLVGLSLARSRAAARARAVAPGAWYRRQLRRAAGLWAISVVFFTLEMGVRLPDALTANGILGTISYAIVLCGALLLAPRPAAALAVTFAAGAALFIGLDAAGARVFAVNSANSPFFPLWLFTLAGGLWGTLMPPAGADDAGRGHRARAAGGVVAALALAGAAWLIARHGFEALFTKPLGRSDASRLLAAPVYGGAPLDVGYYNLRPWLAAACAGLHLGALAAAGLLLAPLRGKGGEKVARFVFALGRHALLAYVLHLALLATLVVTGGPRPLPTALAGTLTLCGVIVVCQLVTFCADKLRGQKESVQ